MKIPKAAWWVIAPLSWLWQYLVYVPAHLLWNVFAIVVNAVLGGSADLSEGMVEPLPRFRPWFIQHLRSSRSGGKDMTELGR